MKRPGTALHYQATSLLRVGWERRPHPARTPGWNRLEVPRPVPPASTFSRSSRLTRRFLDRVTQLGPGPEQQHPQVAPVDSHFVADFVGGRSSRNTAVSSFLFLAGISASRRRTCARRSSSMSFHSESGV